MAQKVKITDTVLRDAHQSLLATRMKIDDMLPIAEKLDAIGYHSLEVWGGATFDSCLRFLNEDPWERLSKIREAIPNTKLQMLLRGQNVVGYRHYADDVLESFVVKAVDHGIDIFRIFDALNDIRNLEVAIKAAKDAGAHVQGTVSYTVSPVHSIEKFLEFAKELEARNVDSICIKDMAGLLSPFDSYELVKRFKEELSVPIQLHCHYTSGMAAISYVKAIEAGVDVIDTAISSMALATSQPPTETLVATLKGTPYDTGLDLKLLSDIAKYFSEIRKKYHVFECGIGGVDTDVLTFQIPGGMLSNLVSQLRDQNALDKYDDVLKEVPAVRKELGYPPLVTPTSQIVGTQAVFNVVAGERYKIVPKEVQDYIKGLYGKTAAPLDDAVRKKIIGDEKPYEGRPADLLKPELPAAREAIKEYSDREEDAISYALFPQPTLDFLKNKAEGFPKVCEVDEKLAGCSLEPGPNAKEVAAAGKDSSAFQIVTDGKEYDVEIGAIGSSNKALLVVVDGKEHHVFLDIGDADAPEGAPKAAKKKNPKDITGKLVVKPPMPGRIVGVKVAIGDTVKEGDLLLILEAMKMQNEIRSTVDGTVKDILVEEGATVANDDVLLVVD